MKKTIVCILLVAGSFAQNLKPQIHDFVGDDPPGSPKPSQTRSVLVSPVGDIRAILGPQGKSIVVNEDGSTVAVIYGDPTSDPIDNPMEVYIAYSTDGGETFTRYGAFSPELRRIYPGIDAAPDFDATAGHVFFTWQESPSGYNTGDQKAMLDENVPSSPSFSTPISLPQATTVFPWETCISVAPDDPTHLIASGWSYLNGGNGDLYCWISNDGGYSWSDPIYMGDNLPSSLAAAPHVRQGVGGYVAATYHNVRNVGGTDIEYPYFIESIDDGITWSSRIALPVPYVDPATSNFWWHELDLEVINNEPWCVHTDLGTDSMWLFHGTGSPGAWTWEVFNVRQLSIVDAWVGDTYYLCYASQYPSITYDPLSGTILVTYKGFYYRGDTLTWADMNGAHVGGIYTSDDGANWSVTYPLSTLNDGRIAWGDWNATETAHRFFADGYWTTDWRVYSVWINEVELNCYFERGYYNGIEERSDVEKGVPQLEITPSIICSNCFTTFNMIQNDKVSMKIYNALGQNIGTLFSGMLDKGIHKLPIDISRFPNGTYFIVFETISFRQSAKITKIK